MTYLKNLKAHMWGEHGVRGGDKALGERIEISESLLWKLGGSMGQERIPESMGDNPSGDSY